MKNGMQTKDAGNNEPTIAEVMAATRTLATTFEAFKQANDQAIQQVKKGFDDVVTKEKVDRINDAVTEAQQKLQSMGPQLKSVTDKLDAVEKMAARPNGGKEGEVIDPQSKAYKEAFLGYVRKGHVQQFEAFAKSQIAGFEQKDGMTVVGDPTGGYFVPPDFQNRIVKKAYETTPMRKYATIMTTSSDAVEFPADATDIGGGWIGETDTRTVTTGVAPGLNRIAVREVWAEPKVSQKTLDDNGVNLEEYLAGRIGDKIARLQNAAFVSGDGVSAPKGFTQYAVATTTDDARAWGTLQYVGTGANGALNASSPGDALFDLVAAVKSSYLDGSNWFMPRSVQNLIRKVKNTATGYIWEPALTAGVPASLLGYPVELSQDMPTLGTGSLSAAFGNFREGYTILDRMGLRLLRDNLTVKGFVLFYTNARVGGGVVNSEAIKLLKFS